MTELELALSRLKGVKKTANGFDALCPCHGDKHQSLSVCESPNGMLLLFCHAGCSFESIAKALGLVHNEPIKDTPIITDTYNYISIEGLPYQVVRYHPKAFKHRQPDGKGGWVWNVNGLTPSLYHIDEVKQAIAEGKLVFIVEGEKDANNLRKNGQVATTISGGASTKWHPSLIPLFEGARVVILPDNDEAGRKYALYVANLLYGWCSSLKLLKLEPKDVSVYLETRSIYRLLEMVNATSEYIPQGAVTREECQSCRGLNRYLWNELKKRKPRRQPKYS